MRKVAERYKKSGERFAAEAVHVINMPALRACISNSIPQNNENERFD